MPTDLLIDPEAVTTISWRALDDNGVLLPTELSLDGGVTWALMPTGFDRDGKVADQWTFAGHGVSPVPAGATKVIAGTTPGIVRVVDIPEIEVAHFSITCP